MNSEGRAPTLAQVRAMTIKIGKKIKGYSVEKPNDKAAEVRTVLAPVAVIETAPSAEVIQMHEKVERPEMLIGATYKIKSPLVEHALYVTINDIVLNEGTEYQLRRPFEIFINSKNMDHFQWIVALTRIMSAVFRKGGDVTFLVEELKAVFDPRGGYYKAGGVYMSSIVAELGAVIEQHLKSIGLLHDPELSPEARAMIADKRAAYERGAKKNADASVKTAGISGDLAGAGAESAVRTETDAAAFPAGATLCNKCNTSAMIVMDGCETCLNCGYSKCG
mgnify:CR=1 FL=1